MHQHGYRQKDGFCRVSWSNESVLEKISKLDSGSYLKCMLAYRFLTTSEKSRYNPKLSGNTSRQSAKVSFIMKILSEILDYSLDYNLLQFVYHGWVFTTVTGTISTSRVFDTSAATARSTKTFSLEYWKSHHQYLIDAVRQFGYPDVFITISPYQWSFLTPVWLENASSLSGKVPTQLASLETLNIVHILEETVKGYLCGTNCLRWRQHMLNFEQ